jgi:CHAD domain-containing protein
MSYQLDPNIPLRESLRATARAELERALADLHQLPADEAVHQLRKCCKKLRALFRLLRGDAAFARRFENAHYRIISRTLSASRDPVSLRDALISLGGSFPHTFPHTQALLENAVRAIDQRDALAQAEPQLLAGLARLDQWPLEHCNRKLLRKNYRRGYRRARRAMTRAFASGSAADFHEFRKRVKDHWYHTRLLHDWDQSGIGARQQPLKELAQALGDWHDVALLRERMGLQGEDLAGELIPLLDAADARLNALRVDIEQLGRQLFAKKKIAVDVDS